MSFGPDALLRCYARGVFPMADGRDDPRLFMVDPEQRGIMPLERFHVPKRLAKTVRNSAYVITIDQAFDAVVQACATPTFDRPETWINQTILELYGALFRRGQAHSVECWHEGRLVGGLYGVRLGAAFFGESMFSRARDASKVCLVHLVGHLCAGGFKLLDTQFMTDHLRQFGTEEISRAHYKARLKEAINCASVFPVRSLQEHLPVPERAEAPLQSALSDLEWVLPEDPGPGPLPPGLLPGQPWPHLSSAPQLVSQGALCLQAIAAVAVPRHSPRT
jgi:leucyl/phenylalanyl-tRNA---protein transferase